MARALLDGSPMMRSLAIAVLVVLTGCDLYFGGGGDDDRLQVPAGWRRRAGRELSLRNPQTGLCEGFGGWGGCDGFCGPCPYAALTIALPDWGYCHSACDGLDEQSCQATSGCIAAYDEYAPYADAPSSTTFKGCWAVAQSGPVQGGGCWNLDAQECSRHDDCALYYGYDGDIPHDALIAPSFTRCGPEPTTQGCAAVDCGPGYHCEEQCYACDGKTGPCDPSCTPMCVPDTNNSCTSVLCGPGFECVEVCDTMQPTPGGMLPPGHCYPACVPVGGGDPGECTGPVTCFHGQPACPTGTVPGILDGCWSGYCIPDNACGPKDPGTCEPAVCDAIPPACPANTVPGVKNGCYTGYCIPSSACAPSSCEALSTEGACAARPDCTPVYAGGDCTCTANGCTCEQLTFARCEAWGMMPF